jgi:hypothetical protein
MLVAPHTRGSSENRCDRRWGNRCISGGIDGIEGSWWRSDGRGQGAMCELSNIPSVIYNDGCEMGNVSGGGIIWCHGGWGKGFMLGQGDVWSMGVSWRRRSVMWSWVIAFMLRLVSGGSSNTGAPSIFRFCMNSHVDQYIVIIVILDTNWSAWNFDQNTWYEICPGYMDLNEICCLFLWLRTWLLILLVRLIWWALPTIIPAVKLPRRLWFDMSRPMRIQARK